jgi:hypothetical protein
MWSGLVRDFYRERRKKVLESLKKGEKFNSTPWEVEWVESNRPLSRIEPFPDPLSAAKELVQKAPDESLQPVKYLE